MSVEQAAERLRRDMAAKTYEESPYFDPETNRLHVNRRHFDERDVIDAWLDQRPLSEEILRASGWVEGFKGWMPPHGSVCLWREYQGKAIAGGRWRQSGCQPEHAPQTVGDLRRLLSALHIDCEVVVPESEASNG